MKNNLKKMEVKTNQVLAKIEYDYPFECITINKVIKSLIDDNRKLIRDLENAVDVIKSIGSK